MKSIRAVYLHLREPFGFQTIALIALWTTCNIAGLHGLYAQSDPWQSGSGTIYETGSNVGIGTTNPVTALSVNGIITAGSANSTAGSVILEGSYGDPSVLSVWGTEYASGAPVMGYGVEPSTSASGSFISSAAVASLPRAAVNVGSSGNISFYTGTAQTVDVGSAVTMSSAMTILNGGNVGIGTTSPQYSLSVNGTIGATEIIVSGSGADYVFDPGYHLAPLTEVAAFIEENHRLPDIPSAREVEQKGVSLGDMQAKLLAKIEELTLHMIQADEASRRVEQQLEDENRQLRERIARLESRDQAR